MANSVSVTDGANASPLEWSLRQGLAALGLELRDAQVEQLLAYQNLIQKWTKVYNLTAVRDASEMLTHHLLDSLAVVNPLRRQLAEMVGAKDAGWGPGGHVGNRAGGEQDGDEQGAKTQAEDPLGALRLLDVGSGAGLPGVVLAICCPELTVHCVDTVAKKAAFIQQVAATLRLPNLRGIHARVESLKEQYAVVSSRAFASLGDFTRWSEQALAPGGIWMAMKGKHPADELADLPPGVEMFHVERLQVPGLDADRCIIWMRQPR